MSSRCRDVHAYADGELGASERAAFERHLVACRHCPGELEVIFALGALARAARPVRPLHAIGPLDAVRPPVPRRLGAVGLATALCGAAAFWFVARSPEGQGPDAWALGANRPLEPRLHHPPADVYRPYDPLRGQARASSPDYRRLEQLERQGDKPGLVALLLLDGEIRQATRVLEAAPNDPSLDNDRAVLALLQKKPSEAFGWTERALARSSGSPQAHWNQGLALRDMGLALAAAAAFTRVEKKNETGWAGEAQSWATKLTKDVEERKRVYRERTEQVQRLMWRRVMPPETLVEDWPDLIRAALYEAVATAPSGEAVKGLEPLASGLDRHFGERALTGHLQRVQRMDFARRAPLADRYGRLAESGWSEPEPGDLKRFAASLRHAGVIGRDLLLGLILARPQVAVDGGEATRLTEDRRDAWLALAAQESEALLEPDVKAGGRQEQLLRRAGERARANRYPFLELRLADRLIRLLLNQYRPVEATPVAQSALREAQRAGLWLEELQLLQLLVDVTSQLQDTSGVIAHVNEIELRDGCGGIFRSALARLTERLVFDRRYADARKGIEKLLLCTGDAGLPPVVFPALSELARHDLNSRETLRFHLTRHRASLLAEGPAAVARESLYLDALEGRALLDSDRTVGGRMLEAVLTRTDRPGKSGLDKAGPRLMAFRRLISDATRAGELPRALSLMAREAGLELPDGCVLGISEDLGQASVVARVEQRHLGRAGTPAQGGSPQAAVPEEISRALSTCSEVAVVASSPLRGRSRLLPPALAWRHLAGATHQRRAPWVPARRVVVSDVASSGNDDLPSLPPWQATGTRPIHRHLRGPEATPGAVLAELERADLIEFHVHGVADFQLSAAPHLLLSEDPDGNNRLAAEAIRTRTLTHHPFVVLAACDSARNSPFIPSYSGQLGLPTAFLEAGARAVLAADRPVPDRSGTIFVAEVMERIQSGVAGAVALRDARMSWLKKADSDWVNDVVLFE